VYVPSGISARYERICFSERAIISSMHSRSFAVP
jgi:hypothetical protein